MCGQIEFIYYVLAIIAIVLSKVMHFLQERDNPRIKSSNQKMVKAMLLAPKSDTFAKEPYFSQQSLIFSAKGPHISEKELCLHQKAIYRRYSLVF